MQIGCTKKLLDYIGCKATAADETIDPVLRWSANLLTIDHRRAIVVANDSSRYGFVIYGMKKKDLKDLDRLIIEGVRSCFEAELMDPGIIERYLSDIGSSVTYTKTASRSLVAHLNQFCNRVYWVSDDLSTEFLLQRHILLEINDDLVSRKNNADRDYESVYTVFGEDMAKRYGGPVYRCRAAQFEVELQLDGFPCRRTIIVPMDYTFYQLHRVLQQLFCWRDYHLHDFWIERHPNGRLKYTLIGSEREFDLEEELVREDVSVFLSEIFPQYDHIIYNYDFGDNWTHHIRLLRIIDDYDHNHATCIDWEGEAPPEDCGGPGGYARLLQILADQGDPEHREMKSWYDSMYCQPFNLMWVNRRLEGCARRLSPW